MLFVQVFGSIAIMVAVPLMTMRAAGQFVGQKPPRQLFRSVIMLLVGGGLVFALVLLFMAMHRDGMDMASWFGLAWMTGSALAAWIALADKLGPRES